MGYEVQKSYFLHTESPTLPDIFTQMGFGDKLFNKSDHLRSRLRFEAYSHDLAPCICHSLCSSLESLETNTITVMFQVLYSPAFFHYHNGKKSYHSEH